MTSLRTPIASLCYKHYFTGFQVHHHCLLFWYLNVRMQITHTTTTRYTKYCTEHSNAEFIWLENELQNYQWYEPQCIWMGTMWWHTTVYFGWFVSYWFKKIPLRSGLFFVFADTNFPDVTIAAAGNKCRNPTHSPLGAWCFTDTQGRIINESCMIPACGKYKIVIRPKTRKRWYEYNLIEQI